MPGNELTTVVDLPGGGVFNRVIREVRARGYRNKNIINLYFISLFMLYLNKIR